MVVITISYPHTPRYTNNNYNSRATSTSVSPTLSNTSSEQLPSPLQVSSDGETLTANKQGKEKMLIYLLFKPFPLG